jgi:hypothetical protein
MQICDFTIQADEVDSLKWVDIEFLKSDHAANPEKYIPGLPLQELHAGLTPEEHNF